jgi:hypothetical protein
MAVVGTKFKVEWKPHDWERRRETTSFIMLAKTTGAVDAAAWTFFFVGDRCEWARPRCRPARSMGQVL